MKNRVLVFTPTYNEIGNIEKWLDEVALRSSADILVVDDSSSDGTNELLALKSRGNEATRDNNSKR